MGRSVKRWGMKVFMSCMVITGVDVQCNVISDIWHLVCLEGGKHVSLRCCGYTYIQLFFRPSIYSYTEIAIKKILIFGMTFPPLMVFFFCSHSLPYPLLPPRFLLYFNDNTVFEQNVQC